VSASAPVVLISIPHGGSAGNVLRTGLVNRLLASPLAPVLVIASPLVEDAAFIREFEHARVRFEPLPPHRPSGLEGRLFALIQAAYIDSGVTESVKIRRAEAAAKKDDPLDSTEASSGFDRGAVDRSQGDAIRPGRPLDFAPRGPMRFSNGIGRRCWSRRIPG
jgi:hypothetical protein